MDCATCKHPNHEAIDIALAAREPLRSLAKRYGLNHVSLYRHDKNHRRALPPVLGQGPDAGGLPARAGEQCGERETPPTDKAQVKKAVTATWQRKHYALLAAIPDDPAELRKMNATSLKSLIVSAAVSSDKHRNWGEFDNESGATIHVPAKLLANLSVALGIQFNPPTANAERAGTHIMTTAKKEADKGNVVRTRK